MCRYYVNTTFFRKPKAGEAPPPLFFIPGGEWSVTPTKGVLYGMAHELAEQHGGLMAIAEHRYEQQVHVHAHTCTHIERERET